MHGRVVSKGAYTTPGYYVGVGIIKWRILRLKRLNFGESLRRNLRKEEKFPHQPGRLKSLLQVLKPFKIIQVVCFFHILRRLLI